eukprot:1138629-Pelagomonas_calceolata.AAC.8
MPCPPAVQLPRSPALKTPGLSAQQPPLAAVAAAVGVGGRLPAVYGNTASVLALAPESDVRAQLCSPVFHAALI